MKYVYTCINHCSYCGHCCRLMYSIRRCNDCTILVILIAIWYSFKLDIKLIDISLISLIFDFRGNIHSLAAHIPSTRLFIRLLMSQLSTIVWQCKHNKKWNVVSLFITVTYTIHSKRWWYITDSNTICNWDWSHKSQVSTHWWLYEIHKWNKLVDCGRDICSLTVARKCLFMKFRSICNMWQTLEHLVAIFAV